MGANNDFTAIYSTPHALLVMYVDHQVPLAATFPLPFRVLFLVALGVLGWATNLHGLQLLGIDGPGALELRASSSHLPLRSPSSGGHLPARSFYLPLYRIFITYTSWCVVAWLLFRAATQSDIALVDIFRYIPAVCILGLITALVCPFDVFHKRERDWFLSFVILLYLCRVLLISSSLVLLRGASFLPLIAPHISRMSYLPTF